MRNQLRGSLALKVFWVLFGVWAFYCLGATYLLNSSLLKKEIDTWDSGSLNHSFAYSLYPGDVRMEKFKIRHEDRNVRWTAELKNIRAHLDWPQLFSKKLIFKQIEVSDGIFQMLLKGVKDRSCQPTVEKIEGLTQEKPEKGKKSPWTFGFHKIHIADLQEIWMGCVRYQGHVDLAGGFQLKSETWAEIHPTTLTLREGHATHGEGEEVIRSVQGSIQAHIDRFPGDSDTAAVIKNLTAKISTQMSGFRLSWMNHWVSNLKWFELGTEQGELSTELSIEKGKFLSGSRGDLSAEVSRVKLAQFNLSGGIDLKFRVDSHPQLKLLLTDYHLHERETVLYGRRAELTLHASHSQVMPPPDFEYALKAEKVRFDHLENINAFIPPDSPIRVTQGQGELSVDLNSLNKRNPGRLNLDGEAGIRIAERSFRTRLALKVGLSESDLGQLKFKAPRGEMSFSLVEKGEEGKSKGLLKLSGIVADFDGLRYSGRVDALIKNADFTRSLVSGQVGVPEWLMNWVTGEDDRGSATISLNRKGISVRDLSFSSGELDVSGDLCKMNGKMNGRILVWAGPASVGIEFNRGKSNVRLHEAQRWYDGISVSTRNKTCRVEKDEMGEREISSQASSGKILSRRIFGE